MAYNLLNSTKIFPNFGSASRWLAIGGQNPNNHIKLKLLRSDGLATVITNGSGNTRLDSYGTAPSSLTIGGKIYLIAYDGGGAILIQGLYNITAFASGVITTDLPYSASYVSINIAFITDYQNFYYRAHYLVDGELVGTSVHFSSPDCTFYVDASPFLKPSLAITSKIIPTSGNNDIADDIDAACEVVLYEVYEGPDGPYDDVATGADLTMYVVNASNQIQNPKGVSLVDKITNTTPSQLMKFLRDTEQPTYFKGYPFHTTFIYSELLSGLAIDYEHTEYDINASPISTGDQAINTANINHVNRAFIRATLLDNTNIIKVKLKKHSGGTALSELLSIRYKICNDPNIVFLKWIGPSGAWNFWLFSYNQTESLETASSQGTFSQFIEDLATAESDSEWISKEAAPELVLGVDGLDRNDMTLLKTLLSSPKVMMLMNPTTWVADGEIYQTVKVKTGKFKIGDTRANLNSLEFAISLNEIYVQEN